MLELVQEVLAADPQNAKAKALLDLSAIKLSKRKLYKKIAGTQPSPPPSNGSTVTNTSSAPPDSPNTRESLAENSGAEPDSQFSLPNPHSRVIEPLPRRRRGLPESDGSAAGLDEGKNHFGAGRPAEEHGRHASRLEGRLSGKDWLTNADACFTVATRTCEASDCRECMPIRPQVCSDHSPQVSTQQHCRVEQHERAVLKANRDFLPGSLDELFEAKREKPAVLPQVEPRPPVVTTGNTARRCSRLPRL